MKEDERCPQSPGQKQATLLCEPQVYPHCHPHCLQHHEVVPTPPLRSLEIDTVRRPIYPSHILIQVSMHLPFKPACSRCDSMPEMNLHRGLFGSWLYRFQPIAAQLCGPGPGAACYIVEGAQWRKTVYLMTSGQQREYEKETPPQHRLQGHAYP